MPDETMLVFGHPPERRGGGHPKLPVKGQRRALEKLLPPPIPKKPPEKVVRRKRVAAARRQEAERTDWEEFIFNEGTRDEFRMLGRYYELAEDVTPLGLFDAPPGIGDAKKLGSIKRGDSVFVIKDSEESSDPRRRGWAEIVVLQKGQEGEKPKIRKFDDGALRRITVNAWHKGIIDRQVLKAK